MRTADVSTYPADPRQEASIPDMVQPGASAELVIVLKQAVQRYAREPSEANAGDVRIAISALQKRRAAPVPSRPGAPRAGSDRSPATGR